MLNAMAGLLAGSFPAHAPRSSARPRVRDEGLPARSCHRQRGRPHVIDAELFRGALVRERRRADRFGEPFTLVRVSFRADGHRDASRVWAGAIEALAASKRDTDVLGWFERGSTLGLIVPREGHTLPAPELQAHVRRELANRVDRDALERLSVRVEGYAPGGVADPLLADLPAISKRKAARRAFKRVLDVVGSAALLAVLAPLFLLIAALVKLTSPGPVFFRQVRVGEGTRPFTMLKFRTMQVAADPAIHQQFVSDFIKAGGAAPKAVKDGVFKIVNDPRVTKVGSFLRKSSLDELPQIWNVLRGDMSLVGPRPPLAYEVEQYKPWHCRRVLDAKPGITGLWQVNGRSRTTFDDMVRLDLRYARNCSLWTDIKILLATPRAVVTGKGAG